MSTLVYCIYCIALFYTARGASVDIVRDTLGDVLTTKACVSEICEQYGGKCIDRNRCQCRADRTTYLRYYQRCMPNYNLTTTLNRSEGNVLIEKTMVYEFMSGGPVLTHYER